MIQEPAQLLELADRWTAAAVKQADSLTLRLVPKRILPEEAQGTLAMFDVADRLRALANQDITK